MREIRPLQPGDDLRAVADVYVRAWQAGYAGLLPQMWLNKLQPERWMPAMASEPQRTLVLFENGRALGACAYAFSRDEGREGFGEIVSLYLLPEEKGRGEGRRLLVSAMKALAEEGCEQACLWVFEDNAYAIAFYEHMGFRLCGRVVTELYGTARVRLVEMICTLECFSGVNGWDMV